jgi:hypothetical protein
MSGGRFTKECSNMNLKRAMFWRRADTNATPSAPAEPAAGAESAPDFSVAGALADEPLASAQVIPLTRPGATGFEHPTQDEFGLPPVQPAKVKGLMNAPELETFFKTNQFGFGRHHGSHYRTQEALDRGLLAVVTGFQNIVADLAERRQARMAKLLQKRQEVATLSATMAETLRLACDQVEREIQVLTEQHALAEQRKGWVLDALNRYQLGFDRGVREALDFELLNV